MHLLKADEIEVYYGDVSALRGVSFQLDDEEIISILGSNAAGKTTVMLTISRLIPMKAGSILFRGEPIHQLRPHHVVDLGIVHVPEGREIFAHMTVLENLEMGAHIGRARKDWKINVENIFNRFPILKSRRRQLAGTLSGGEQQMLAIGRGLMAKPRLLLLDEPSLGLAPLAVKNIFDIIGRIKKDRIPILLVEQNVSNALQISNRAYVLENGRIVNQGSGQELLKDDHMRKTYLGM
jgi:branched-chain amino acid transport system ATP-binding protein